MTVSFPIAADAQAAIASPAGRAAREREARAAAGQDVAFVRELTGPAFATREQAEAAYPGLVDGAKGSVAPEDRWCELMEVVEAKAGGRRQAGGQAEPTFAAGRRWPQPKARLKTAWRLQVSYWRLVQPGETAPDLPQARAARRSEQAQGLDASALRALAGQSLRPVKPQQPLDIGLFEVRLPEAPDQTIPDE